MPQLLDVFSGLSKGALIAGLVTLGSCTTARTILKQAPTERPAGWSPEVRPGLDAETTRSLLQSEIYGRIDLEAQASVADMSELDPPATNPAAKVLQWALDVTYADVIRPLDLVLVLPEGAPDAPIILTQNFCPNQNVLPLPGVRSPDGVTMDCSGGGLFGLLMTRVFGRYIVEPPIADILDRGYGLAVMYPAQVVPDRAQAGNDLLDSMFPGEPNRPGALAVWADLIDLAADVIEAEVGERTLIAYGHSRFGKTALLAGAWFETIDAVVAHQSGTLGASTLDDRDGEPVSALVESYPHWPALKLSTYADHPGSLPVGPSDLLGLLADKPVLLGNARRDVWSDPWGAFKEAKAAWSDFAADEPSDFRPGDAKAYWLRAGTHGVVKEDWPAFLDFLDANVK
ncbi:MAG: hypothetical protein WBG08_09355 [Litorimonas sp.]